MTPAPAAAAALATLAVLATGVLAGCGSRAAGQAAPSAPPVRLSLATSAEYPVVALLVAGRGAAARLLGAWSNQDGTSWALSQPYQLGGGRPLSASFGSGSSGSGSLGVVVSGGRAVWVSGPGAAWRTLPGLPAKASSAPDGGATLAAAPGGGFEALSARGSQLSVWSLSSRGSGWSRSQVMNVAIPYGSSG